LSLGYIDNPFLAIKTLHWVRFQLVGYLSLKPSKKIEEVELVVVDKVEGLPDDAVDRLLGRRQQRHQPDLNAALGPDWPFQVNDFTFAGHNGQDLVVILKQIIKTSKSQN
jgi:hypothetical protein